MILHALVGQVFCKSIEIWACDVCSCVSHFCTQNGQIFVGCSECNRVMGKHSCQTHDMVMFEGDSTRPFMFDSWHQKDSQLAQNWCIHNTGKGFVSTIMICRSTVHDVWKKSYVLSNLVNDMKRYVRYWLLAELKGVAWVTQPLTLYFVHKEEFYKRNHVLEYACVCGVARLFSCCTTLLSCCADKCYPIIRPHSGN